MPSLGAPELLVIMFIILVVFGAGKLPEVGSAVGKGIREFRKASGESVDGRAPTEQSTVATTTPDRRCAQCGRSASASDSFCATCGTRLGPTDS